MPSSNDSDGEENVVELASSTLVISSPLTSPRGRTTSTFSSPSSRSSLVREKIEAENYAPDDANIARLTLNLNIRYEDLVLTIWQTKVHRPILRTQHTLSSSII